MLARLAAVGLTVALASGCGAGPTSPGPSGATPNVPLPSAFEGVWQLEYRVAECSGERHCVFYIGTTNKIHLRLVRAGGGFDGVVSVAGENVDVTGTVADGALVLTGRRLPAIANDFDVEIKRLELRNTDGTLGGNFEYTVKGSTSTPWFFGNSRRSGPIVASNRLDGIRPGDATNFNGAWKGRVAVRDCSAVGWRDCYPHEPRELWPFELQLTQAGTRVTGSLLVSGSTRIDVQGTVSGSSISLQGSSVEKNYAFDEVSTLRLSTLTRDVAGRLKGTISFDIKWVPTRPEWVLHSTDFRSVELVSVVLQPS